jgi:molybdate transport system substrate-binding protein
VLPSVLALAPLPVLGAELKIASSPALTAYLRDLGSAFEQSSGHKLAASFASPTRMRDLLGKDRFDVVISTVQLIEELEKTGIVKAGIRTDLAKVGVGVSFRRGAGKPDVSTVEALKSTLLAAKSIAHGNPTGGGVAAVYVVKLFDQLGIVDAMKPKIKLMNAHASAEAIGRGEIELGLTQIGEIVAYPTIELAGPLPAELQNYTSLAAGLLNNSTHAGAVAFLRYLGSSTAADALKAHGLEPFPASR